jgi:hypothetical protein
MTRVDTMRNFVFLTRLVECMAAAYAPDAHRGSLGVAFHGCVESRGRGGRGGKAVLELKHVERRDA